jgi:hypothetical protein
MALVVRFLCRIPVRQHFYRPRSKVTALSAFFLHLRFYERTHELLLFLQVVGKLTGVIMNISISTGVTPCSLIDSYQRFGGTIFWKWQKMEAVGSFETVTLLYQTARRHVFDLFLSLHVTCWVLCFFVGLNNIRDDELLICWPPRCPDFRLGRWDIPCSLISLSIPFHIGMKQTAG